MRDGNAEERHRPAIGPGQTEQGADQGCLPRTIRSEVAEGGAPRHEEFDVVDGDGRVEALGEAVRLDGPSVTLTVTEGDVTSSAREPLRRPRVGASAPVRPRLWKCSHPRVRWDRAPSRRLPSPGTP